LFQLNKVTLSCIRIKPIIINQYNHDDDLYVSKTQKLGRALTSVPNNK
jgi:hypothetical protein